MEIIKKELIEYPYLEKPLSLYTFDNGYKVVLAHKKSPMINISSWVKTGSINENKDNNGVSHFVEHLLFKGTTKYAAGVFDRKMEEKGGIINAATWKDYTFYYINIPKEHYKLALDMHADMMVDAIFPESEIGPTFDPNGNEPDTKRERYVVIEEIRMGKDNNWRKVYSALNDAMYELHPYKREVIGTQEIIANISQKEIMSYYKTFYVPKNITTILVGDFDEETVINQVKEEFKFKEIPNVEKSISDERIIEKQIKNPKIIINKADVTTGYLMMGALCDSAKNLKETIALDLLSTILGDGKSSRLYSKFIEKPKEPYYFQIESVHYQFKDGDNFFIEANFDAGKKDVVVDDIKSALLELQDLTDIEIKKAKKRAKVNFAQESEMVSDIADSIGYFATVCDDIGLAHKYLNTLDEIDKNYLQDIVKKYLNPGVVSFALLLPDDTNKKED